MCDIKKKPDEMTEIEYIQNYDINRYDRPSVTVDTLLFTIADQSTDNYRKLDKKKMKILLVKRKEHPYRGQWALPGGFVRLDESIEEAAYRELQEETGVKEIYIEQLYTFGDIKRDPRGRIISAAYLALVDKDKLEVNAGTDAEEASWFEVQYRLMKKDYTNVDGKIEITKHYSLRLESDGIILESSVVTSKCIRDRQISFTRKNDGSKGIAFDHGLIIQQGIERLQSKLEYTDIVFNLMPEYFTLSELQKAYEEILNKKLLKANFRRKISRMVLETEKMTSDKGHRPSKLYKYNPMWEEAPESLGTVLSDS